MTFNKVSAQNDLILKKLDKSFAEEIAVLHASSLSGDVLPALGNDVLIQYYQYVLRNHSQLVVGAISKGKFVGFCQLSFTPITVLGVLGFAPWVLFRVLKLALLNTRLFISGVMLASNRPEGTMMLPAISFIAVCQDFQGQGIGKKMVEEVNKLVAAKNLFQITTMTSNEIARTMYEKLFDARVIATKVVSGKEYWHLCWKTEKRKP